MHGPGGIGKSRLLRQFVDGVPAGTASVVLDGRDVEPTPRGFRQALGRALGLPAGDPGTSDVVAALRDGGAGRTVLVVDTYETLGLLDGWLRTRFLPALPASVLTVFAGRDRPAAAWHTAAGWAGLVAEFPPGALSDADALALLPARGLDDAAARRLNAFAHGHPLALELGAAGASAGADGTPVLPELLDAFLGGLPAAAVPPSRPPRPSAGSPSRCCARCSARTAPGTRSTRCARCRSPRPSGTGCCCTTSCGTPSGCELAVRDPDTRRAYRQRAARYSRPGRTRPTATCGGTPRT